LEVLVPGGPPDQTRVSALNPLPAQGRERALGGRYLERVLGRLTEQREQRALRVEEPHRIAHHLRDDVIELQRVGQDVRQLMQRHAAIRAIDSMRSEIRRRTGITLRADSLASGYALDRAMLGLGRDVDSVLLDLGGQYSWFGPPGRGTHRAVGVPDPDNTLRTLAVVDLQGGSVRTQSQRNAPHGAARSVTVLADDGLTAHAWAAAFLALGCD